jgi:hypothetical protein
MDWTLAIETNRAALKRVLAALVAMTGGTVFTSPLRGGRAAGAGGVILKWTLPPGSLAAADLPSRGR